MPESILAEEVAAADAYEALHVPALFGQWTGPVLDAAGVGAGDRVLDVACGTGVLARAAATRVGAAGIVTGIDAGAGMLAVAQRLAPKVAWLRGSAESLPFPDAAFDAAASQFGLMFFGDRQAALREMMRVLAPGGRLVVAVWDTLERSAAYAIETALVEQVAGTRAADALRAPFALGERETLTALCARAGVPPVAISTHTGTARFPSIESMVEADLRGWLPIMGVILPEEVIRRILAEAERALRRYVTGDGTVAFDAPAHLVVATKR